MFDNYDEDFDEEFDSEEEELEELEELEEEELEEFDEREEELIEELVDTRDEIADTIHEKRDAIQDRIDELRDEMAEMGDLRREIDDFRRMKEDMKREMEDLRRDREEYLRAERHVSHSRPPRPVRPVRRAPKPPKPPKTINISAVTDSLEDMMEGLGEQIEMSIQSVKGLDKIIPSFTFAGTKSRKRKRSKRDIESIPPERVAKVLAPLGSEERLKILDFLRTEGKTFNEIEIHTEKTGSSLTHHLNPLIEAGYVIKGEVRGTYYETVEGRLAYRLAQWLTSRLEKEKVDTEKKKVEPTKDDSISIKFDSDEDDASDDWSEDQ